MLLGNCVLLEYETINKVSSFKYIIQLIMPLILRILYYKNTLNLK